MIVAVCLDEHGGVMFNHRRQSLDRELRARLLREAGEKHLLLNSYSASQFTEEDLARLEISEDFLDKAGPGDYCFVEDRPVCPYEEKIEKLLVFKWNRIYPSDTHFDIDLSCGSWRLIESSDFPGYSHEKITLEVYVK